MSQMILRLQTSPSSCVKSARKAPVISHTWRNECWQSFQRIWKISLSQIQRWQLSLKTVSFWSVIQICENNLDFTATPHTPLKREGVLFITQRRQATSDLRENPKVKTEINISLNFKIFTGYHSWLPCCHDLSYCGYEAHRELRGIHRAFWQLLLLAVWGGE